jgi:hypothetical protein
MRVAVVMFYDDNVKEYGDINYQINRHYCERYNLELIHSNEKVYTDRHSAWERLPLLLKHLNQYDYLIWIDADAYFYNDAGNVIDLIQKTPDTHFIFSNDFGNENVNTGFFIIKNSSYSIEFLRKWANDEYLYKNNPYPKWWDQGVLIDMMNQNTLDIQNNSVSYEYGQLQHFHQDELSQFSQKPYVFHMAGKSYQERVHLSKEYYARLVDPTIVTAFYDIRRLEQSDPSQNRAVEQYIDLAKQFILQLPYPLVIFIDADESADHIYNVIKTSRENYVDKTHIVREPFDNTHFYKDLDRLRDLQQKYPIYNGNLAHETPHYIILNNNKFWCVEKAIETNPFKSTHFMWMDFGINHVAKHPEKIHEWIHHLPDKVRQLCINPLVEQCCHKDLFHYIYHHYAGGVFSGSAEYLLKYVDAFKQKTDQIYGEDWYQIDEAVMTMVHCEHPEWFDDYYGDYEGILSNYKEPMHSWWLIFRSIEKCLQHNNCRFAKHILDFAEPTVPEDWIRKFAAYTLQSTYYNTKNPHFIQVIRELTK